MPTDTETETETETTTKQYALGTGLGVGIALQLAYAAVNLAVAVHDILTIGVVAVARAAVESSASVVVAFSGIVLQAGGGAPSGQAIVDAIIGAACQIGVGALITAVLFLLGLKLGYLSLGDFEKYFASKNSRDSAQRSETGGHLQAAGKKLGGAVMISTAPIWLSAIGFQFLSCVQAAPVFS